MAGKNRIVINASGNKEKYITIKASNNKTLATTETYKSNQGINSAIKALEKVVKNAIVVDKTKKK